MIWGGQFKDGKEYHFDKPNKNLFVVNFHNAFFPTLKEGYEVGYDDPAIKAEAAAKNVASESISNR